MIRRVSAKYLLAILLVTGLCCCSRFTADLTNPNQLVLEAMFLYSKEQLAQMGEMASSYYVAVSFRDTVWFVVLFPVLAVFPWIGTFSDQWNGGSYYLILSRKTRRRYAFDRLLKAAVSGFGILSIGILIYILLVWIKFPVYQDSVDGMTSALYGETSFLRALVLCKGIFHTGLLAALAAVFAMIVVIVLKSPFYALSIPMLIGYVSEKSEDAYLYYLSQKHPDGIISLKELWCEFLFPSHHLFYDMNFVSSFRVNYGVYVVIWCGMFFVLAFVFCQLIKKRNE